MEQPSPGQSDELKGLAILVLVGALGVLALIVFDATQGQPDARPREEESARSTWLGVLEPFRAAPGVPARETPRQVAPSGLGTHATAVARDDDPQMRAFHRSYASEADAGLRQPFSIAYHRGTLVSARGTAVRPGASCEVRVLPVQSYEFNCLVRVMCDDVVIYPDDALRAGYAPCEVHGSEAVSAVDDSSTDGDRELELDVRRRSVVVGEHLGDEQVLSAVVLLES
jgi:hypothetical protein